MKINHLKLITFDATNTLLKFKVSPWEYYTKVAKEHGFHGTENDVKKKFTYNFKVLCEEHPNYGKSSINWENWWSQLVKITLTDYLPVTADLDGIASKLIDDFKSTKCWCTADGVDKLIDHFRKLNMSVGVISNYDPRLYDILQNVGLKNVFDFVVTSYDVGYSKPDERIFKKGIDMCKLKVKPSECLHIGDNLEYDYKGARAAGWHSILVNCNDATSTIPPNHVFKNIEDLNIAVRQNKLIL